MKALRVALPLALALSLALFLFSEEGVVRPNENLVVQGVPPVPSSLAETVARYSEFRSAALAGWHVGGVRAGSSSAR